jgi:hypothetical protein
VYNAWFEFRMSEAKRKNATLAAAEREAKKGAGGVMNE